MSDLVVSNSVSINKMSENTEINLSNEEVQKDKNLVMERQVSKEIYNASQSITNVENTNILQDKTSTFNNSLVLHNVQPPVDSFIKPVENTDDLSVNAKENLNITQNVDDNNKNKQLTIINNASEDGNINNPAEEGGTNFIKEMDNEENLKTSIKEGNTQKKQLTITNSDSEDHNVNNVADKATMNVIKLVDIEENSETSTKKEKKQRKRLTITDSDSDDELNSIAEKVATDAVIDEDFIEEGKMKCKRLTGISSDSEDDNQNNSDKEDDELTEKYGSINDEKKKQRKRLTFINSDDSESENEEQTIAHQEGLDVPSTVAILTEETSQKQTVGISGEGKKKSRLMQICDSDSEEENVEISNYVNTNSIAYAEDTDTEHTLRLQKLCDSESSAEDEETPKINATQMSKVKKTAKLSKDIDLLEKPTTGRDAIKQRQQIKSESQKMCRESHASLPYHRPKQQTLQDFLKRRSLLNTEPCNTPTNFSIKMSGQELKRTVQQLKERERNIALFYKSESEEEEESEEQLKDCSEMEVEHTQKEIEKATDPIAEEKSAADETIVSEGDKIEEEIIAIEKEIVQEEEFQVEKEIEDSLFVDKDEEMDSIQTKIPEVIDKIDDIVTEEVKENAEIDNASEEVMDENTEKNKEEKLKELRIVLQENLGPLNQSSDVKLINDKKIKEPSFEELLSSTILPPVVEPQKKITPEKVQENKIAQRLEKLNPLIALKRSCEPLRLSGSPNEVIVLDEGFERSKNVSNLMKRFFTHTAKKQVQKKTEISVLNSDGIGRHHETIIVTEDVEEPAKKHQIPGLMMKKLREELQEQIKQKRLTEYRRKTAEFKLDNEEGDGSVYEGERMDCGLGDEVLDNEDEEELTDEDSSEEEEDEEENDVELQDKPRVKSAFVDEEAEESDVENQENEPVEEDDDDEDEEKDDNEDEDDELEEPLVSQTKRPLKRIIQTLDESDDEKFDENIEENLAKTQDELSSQKILTTQEQSRLQSSWDDFDEEIPAYQPRNGQKTPSKTMTQNNPDISCFLSPTLNLTALQGRKPGDYSIIEESPKIVLSVPAKPSPLKDHPFLKTRLFSENSGTLDDFDELAALCSGKFPSSNKNNELEGLSTQEQSLLDICSGTFSGLDGLNKEVIATEEAIQNSEEKSGTSQEINKEEFPESSNLKVFDVRNFNYPKFKIASSSDEENATEEVENKKKKLKKKRRYVIDDISLSDEDEENKENDFDDMSSEEDLNELDKLDELDKEEDEERENINYDSEENEVDYEETAQIVKKKARDFFEVEAELSGSEWGSDDEDEKGLDDFDVEDADGEKINEKKVQQELERMHIRNILDEDQRDVRLLQELLLEDGELHGQGREKKFKWKNTSSLTWNEDNAPNEEDEDVEDIESEQQWRKMRHEREAFLNEQKLKALEELEEDDLTASDSQFLKLGQMALQKSISSSQSQMKTTVTESIVMMEDIKLPFNLNNKRGSFLARSETTLARLAEITRTTTGGLNNRAKNSRNFVFAAVEKAEKSTTFIENEKKRKADETVPKVPKKVRITKSDSDANK